MGLHGCQAQLRSCDWNMVSARDHPKVVEKYLLDEVQEG